MLRVNGDATQARRTLLGLLCASIVVIGCGPSDVGTIKSKNPEAGASKFFPPPEGNAAKKAIPAGGGTTTQQAPAKRAR